MKATPRIFQGSFILNNENLSTNLYATGRLLSLKTFKTEVNACCNSYGWFAFSHNDA